jgi:hypothetical protein
MPTPRPGRTPIDLVDDTGVMNLLRLPLAFVIMAWLSVASADALPSLTSQEWAEGPHSAMHMLLEKTVFNVDVLTVDVRVGRQVHRRLIDVIGTNKQYSEPLGERLARVVLEADDAFVEVDYLRDISFKQWMEGVIENLERAEAAKLITKEIRQRAQERVPVAFAALKERGYQHGDRLLYRVRADSVRMVAVSEKGKIYVDTTDSGKDAPRIVLASYFAPRGDFRELLLRSLFD